MPGREWRVRGEGSPALSSYLPSALARVVGAPKRLSVAPAYGYAVLGGTVVETATGSTRPSSMSDVRPAAIFATSRGKMVEAGDTSRGSKFPGRWPMVGGILSDWRGPMFR